MARPRAESLSGRAETASQEGFEVSAVTALGHSLRCYSRGSGPTVLLLNGGPGLPSRYLRAAHSFLTTEGFRILTYDQLDCGASDHPGDPSLWTIARYADEVEAVRKALAPEPIILLGHSWGGWLAIEYMTKYQVNVRALVLADTCANMPHLEGELQRLRGALGAETQTMMLAHEADGSFDHPEYQAAITLLNHRHVCRLGEWPAALIESFNDKNAAIYQAMQGPNEFLYTGNLRQWDRWDSLARITCPTLIVVGRHDELTPACAREMHARLPHSIVRVFPNSAHMPFYEEPEAYRKCLVAFLREPE